MTYPFSSPSTQENRLKALHLMRGLIDEGNENYMCYALDRISSFHPELRKACDDLKITVRCEIEGNSSLQCWITEKLFGLERAWATFPEPYKHDFYFNRGIMNMARLAWIDKLIENESASA